MTKAMPESTGNASKNNCSMSSWPTEAAMPTTNEGGSISASCFETDVCWLEKCGFHSSISEDPSIDPATGRL